MRFALTEDQLMIQQAARDMLAKACPPERVRKAWERTEGRDEALWRDLAGLGALSLHLPEASGGLGLGALELALVLEETGRVAVPEPITEAVVAAKLLSEVASVSTRELWLGPLTEGACLITVAMGTEPYIVSAATASAVLALSDDALHVIEPSGMSLTAQTSVDGARRVFSASWEPSDATLDTTDAAQAWQEARLLGEVASSAQLLGLSQRMLDMSVAYVSERRQFGKPVGSFQAVQHRLADAMIKLNFARPLVWRAAWSLDNADAERRVHASMARIYTSEAAGEVAKAALQVHGAMGYTTEYDLHLFMKRAWALAASWGDAAHHEKIVANALLGAAAD